MITTEQKPMLLSFILPVENESQRIAEEQFERDSLLIANGFSRYTGTGAWQADGDKAPTCEAHVRLDIALLNPLTAGAALPDLIGAFVRYGETAGERALFYIVNGEPRYLDLDAERETEVAS